MNMYIQGICADARVPRLHQATIYVCGEMLRWRLIQHEARCAVEYIGVERILVPAIAPHAHGRRLLNGNRHHVTIVVIGMLAQEVDAPWRPRTHFGRVAEDLLKAVHNVPIQRYFSSWAARKPLLDQCEKFTRRQLLPAANPGL